MRKKIYTIVFPCLVFCASISVKQGFSQGGVYFRETFATGTGPSSDPGASATVTDYTDGNGQVWKFYGLWLTTGTSCTDVVGVTGGSNRHIRSTNNTSLTDSAYAILPEVSAGIYSVSLQRSRNNRRFTFWVNNTSTTDPNDGGWTLANVIPKVTGYPLVLCEDSAVIINSATARRLMIKFERNVNSDIDSVQLTSVGLLPAKFGSLNLQQKKDEVMASWNAFNESNVSGYYLQRSTNGISFEDVSFVRARNVLSAEYFTNDRLKGEGIIFYRVKSVDLDGKTGFSAIAKINTGNGSVKGISVINPVRGNRLEVQMTDLDPGVYQVTLADLSGKPVQARTIKVESARVSLAMDIPAASGKGIKVLSVTGGTRRFATKVVVE